MQKINFSIDISAPREKVWDVLWTDKTYREWTSVFTEGSYAESDWNEGSKILFLSPKGDGMSSLILKKDPPEFMSFKHIAMVKNSEEQPLDEESKKWSGALENYKLITNGTGTTLTVEMDANEDMQAYMNTTFPKALQKVKELSEKEN